MKFLYNGPIGLLIQRFFLIISHFRLIFYFPFSRNILYFTHLILFFTAEYKSRFLFLFQKVLKIAPRKHLKKVYIQLDSYLCQFFYQNSRTIRYDVIPKSFYINQSLTLFKKLTSGRQLFIIIAVKKLSQRYI